MTARLTTLVVSGVLTLTPSPAHAGTYMVTGGCGGNWSAVNSAPAKLAIYGECPTLVVRNVGGPFSTPFGAQAYWRFAAPPRASIYKAQLSGLTSAELGWQTRIFTDAGAVFLNCPGQPCPGNTFFEILTPTLKPTGSLYLRLACAAKTCPNDKGLKGELRAWYLVVTVLDTTLPSVAIRGGTLLAGWHRGTGTVTLASTDNVGIKMDRILLDGTPREQRVRSCHWGARIPCPNGAAVLTLDTTHVPDGRHTVTVQSVDSADNVAGQSRPILVDNTPPAAPSGLASASGSLWRSTNAFALSWRNPVEAFAPIAGVRYEICPAGGTAKGSCVSGEKRGVSIQSINDLSVPAPGVWRVSAWLVDAAGNSDPRATRDAVLRFDNGPPALAFREQSASDPARLRVAAADAVSGVARVEIEARRQGDSSWMPLATARLGNDFTAVMDDEQLPRGLYDLRARAFDYAGNERSTSSRTNGIPARLQLPARRVATIRVGKPTRHCVRKRCRSWLASTPHLDFGRQAIVDGRLEVAGRPFTGAVDVWSQVKLAGAPWNRIATLRPSHDGRFHFRIGPGPARFFRFRFPGSPTVRGTTATVDARVRAATSFKVSRRDVVNGEYVTFRGRLKGRPIPAGGKLVELQVYTRRLWRTFALPRAGAKSGRWSFQYRFETVQGHARFRFRARIRREASYPYYLGTSREVTVAVHGI